MATPSAKPASRHSSSTGRKLKRHKTGGEPPRVQQRICVGDRAVPYEILEIGEQATMVVDLHQGSYNRAAKWLLSSMEWSIMPHPCLLTELKDAVGQGRGNRANGLWKGKDGKYVIDVEVRGRKVKVLNDQRCVRLLIEQVVGDNGQYHYPTVQWVVDELYKDFHREQDASGSGGEGDADHDDIQEREPAGCGDSDDVIMKRIQRLMQSEENVWGMGSVHPSHWFVCRGGGGCEWFDDGG